MHPIVRKLHRKLSPYLFLLVGVSAITGMAYRAGKKWFGMDGRTGQLVMDWHTGEWLGPVLSPFYVLLVGAALLFIVTTGARMLWQPGGKGTTRRWHRVMGGVLLLPLAASAITGMLYRAGQAWFGLSEDTAHLLMTIHEGGWLGKDLKVYYSVTLGSGLLALGFFGLALLRPVERSLNCATSGQKLKKVPTRNATRIERGAVGPRDVDLGPHAPSRDPPP